MAGKNFQTCSGLAGCTAACGRQDSEPAAFQQRLLRVLHSPDENAAEAADCEDIWDIKN